MKSITWRKHVNLNWDENEARTCGIMH